jgi:hypothetical protein
VLVQVAPLFLMKSPRKKLNNLLSSQSPLNLQLNLRSQQVKISQLVSMFSRDPTLRTVKHILWNLSSTSKKVASSHLKPMNSTNSL